MDGSISAGEVITLIAFLVGIIGGVWKATHYINARINTVAKDLQDYKLQVAEKYASVEHLKEVEARLAVSIDRLADRIDRLLSRIDEKGIEPR